MLRELHIKNLALIQDATIEFAPGLNVFTGATGAGKSLVLGALELLLGGRANVQMVRPGAADARVSGVFEMRDAELRKRIAARLETDGWPEGEDLILGRRLLPGGRNTYTVNGDPVTAGVLREIAGQLVDIHGQHEHQLLLTPAHQLEVLDGFADGGTLHRAYAKVYQARRELLAERERLSGSAELRRQQLELFGFQAAEIDKADLQDGELERLEAERKRLANAEKIRRDVGRAYGQLAEAEAAVLDRVKDIAGMLEDLADLDDALKEAAEGAKAAAAELDEVAHGLGRYIEGLEFDPDRLAEVDDRLYRLRRLIDKYGGGAGGHGGTGTVAAVLEYRRGLEGKAEALRRETTDLAGFDERLAKLDKELLEVGLRLRDTRMKAGKRLVKLVERELADLGMENARFTLRESPQANLPALADATPTGFDDIEFLIAPNPGQPAHPLRKIASGGELSRVMLAVKGILADSDRVSVLVFDEVDSNIGGRMGGVIGPKLRRLAKRHQVLCITHLPQIAAFGDRQFTVRKQVVKGESVTTVTAVDGEDRLSEIAEMISGKGAGDITRRQAAEMLDSARKSAG
jgi:DNA repair protein RecN (Recombination protein N)